MATFCLSDAGEQEDVRPDQQTITCRFEFNSVVIHIGDTDRFSLTPDEAGRLFDQIADVCDDHIVVADVTLSAAEAQMLAVELFSVREEYETEVEVINWKKEGF